MRKILFRGKRIDNGEWIEGYLFGHWGNAYICWGMENRNIKKEKVDGVSVGQYTGLKDKNGTKIFEGDILERGGFWGWYVAYEDGGFRKIPINTVQRINWEHSLLEQDTVYYWEIIGNMTDNPELVEEEQK